MAATLEANWVLDFICDSEQPITESQMWVQDLNSNYHSYESLCCCIDTETKTSIAKKWPLNGNTSDGRLGWRQRRRSERPVDPIECRKRTAVGRDRQQLHQSLQVQVDHRSRSEYHHHLRHLQSQRCGQIHFDWVVRQTVGPIGLRHETGLLGDDAKSSSESDTWMVWCWDETEEADAPASGHVRVDRLQDVELEEWHHRSDRSPDIPSQIGF